jgi:hypothetical protein
MRRSALFLTILCCSCFVLAQTSNPKSSSNAGTSSAVQVVYVVDGSTLTTYNVDPQTFQATQAGAITLPQSVYPYITTSPNGRFLYYSAYLNTLQQGKRLYVYDTNASGAPGSSPVQVLNTGGLYGMLVDPAGKFLYAVYAGAAGTQYTPYKIVRFLVDSSTGKISQPVTEARYSLPSGAEGTEYCGLLILGLNAAGSKMYDEVNCGYHGGSSATYNERSVNLQTGVLGADVQVYSWNNASEGGEFVQFVNNLAFDFATPNNYQQGVNYVNIYQAHPNVTTPQVNCTASMLQACGYDAGRAHPSGEYVFMFNSQGATEVDKVEPSQKKIVGPTSSIPYEVQQFSPDGTIAYAANDVNGALEIEIYGFSVSTGSLTAGGTISVPSDLDSWFTAQRH